MDAKTLVALIVAGVFAVLLIAAILMVKRYAGMARYNESKAQELNRHEYQLTNSLIEAERIAVQQKRELEEARDKLSAVERAKGKLYTVQIENKQALIVRLRRTIERTRTVARGSNGRDALARMRAIDEISEEALEVFRNGQ